MPPKAKKHLDIFTDDGMQALVNTPIPPARPSPYRTGGRDALAHEVEAGDGARDDVLVACPDARSPAYQAVVGLARAGRLCRFVTGFYYGGGGRVTGMARQVGREPFSRFERLLQRRHEPGIPACRVQSDWGFDIALAGESRFAATNSGLRLRLARWRVRRFDRIFARALAHDAPRAALVFSDVASEFGLPECRRLGIASVLSMVHGDVREERRVMELEAELAPDFFSIYLGSGEVDAREIAWLHERRLRDIELADRVLVPSEHIASELVRHGTHRDRVAIVPYAADTRRFVPDPQKSYGPSCTFLFAGGVTQRKGIKYLLEAWRMARRPGWRLQLLGALPADPGPLYRYRDEVEWLGRVPYARVPACMASADVFVFPSLFEGSAVVTYEAMACGLPSIVTAEAGSVVRHGRDGLVVPARDVVALAEAITRLGSDPSFRAACSASARARALAHDWPRYHEAVIEAVGRFSRRHD
jgi:glycosyltransferase involved in cell wall biosynthesis